MKCRYMRRKISAYMDQEPDKTSVRQLESHLHQCTECRETLDAFQKIDSMVRGLPAITPDADFSSQMVRLVRESASGGMAKSRNRLSFFERISEMIKDFADMLISAPSPHKGILDEFGDFPPFSIGYIYFKLMEMPAR